MRLHRGFPSTTPDRTICALARAFASAPGRERERPSVGTQPATRADPPGASGQRSKRGGMSTYRSAIPRAYPLARGHIHFSPERALAVRRAPACPEWSVASEVEGGMRRAWRAVIEAGTGAGLKANKIQGGGNY
jgi:hypothetical protein